MNGLINGLTFTSPASPKTTALNRSISELSASTCAWRLLPRARDLKPRSSQKNLGSSRHVPVDISETKFAVEYLRSRGIALDVALDLGVDTANGSHPRGIY